MAADGLMATAVRLGVSVDALAALAAFVRLETEQLPADPAVRDLLGKIAGELVDYDVVPDPASATSVLGLARTFLRQAEELIDNPGRSGGWEQVDIPLLQGIDSLPMLCSSGMSTCSHPPERPGLSI